MPSLIHRAKHIGPSRRASTLGLAKKNLCSLSVVVVVCSDQSLRSASSAHPASL